MYTLGRKGNISALIGLNGARKNGEQIMVNVVKVTTQCLYHTKQIMSKVERESEQHQ